MQAMQLLRGDISRSLFQILELCVCGFLCCLPVLGLDRDRSIGQYYHSAWTAKDGAPSQISSLAQTEDGYLWIGSSRGLFRFDGFQFERYEPPAGITLPSHSINTLMATPDGGLWISFNPAGLGFLKDGQLHIFTESEGLPRSEVYTFVRDFDGRVWGRTHYGLVVFDGSRWAQIGSDWNLPQHGISAMLLDRDGTLWVPAADTIFFLPRGARLFQPTGVQVSGVSQLIQAPDGRLWIAQWFESKQRPIRPLVISDGQVGDSPEIWVDPAELMFDRAGSLWMTSDGLHRIRFPEKLGDRKVQPGDPLLETFKVNDGLTDNSAGQILEDREGNIWVSSNKGLDRFRHSHLVPVELPPGYRNFTLLADDDGTIWVGNSAKLPLLRLQGETLTLQGPAMRVASVWRDSGGTIWWGAQGGVWRQQNNRFDFFPQSIGSFDMLWEVIPDDSGGLWIGLGDIGLTHFKDGVWADRSRPNGILERTPSASYQDSSGRIWLGYTENRVYTLERDQVRAYSREDGIDIGRIRVIRGSGPQFWLGGELGLALFQNGRFRTVRRVDGESFGTVSGIVERDGALWLNELHGIIRIPSEEVRQVIANPDHRVTYETFGFLDGLPGGSQMDVRCAVAINGTDGRLWFATDDGLVWIDPTKISKNTISPPVVIRSLATEAKQYPTNSSLKLPSGTTNVRLEYVALSLSIPERVRFRYRLKGVDKDWQEADTRRSAFYTNLKPGTYVFHVIASNNDGLWNEKGATLEFTIAPAWYQTNWFLFLCIALGCLLVWTSYRLRVRRVARTLSDHFDERLAERTRIARDLHDTLLQTVQAGKMVADTALEQPEDAVRLRHTVQTLSQWFGRAVTEGRAALNSLRTSGSEHSNLAEDLRQVAHAWAPDSMDVSVSTLGDARAMHPIVGEEVYRISYEAIRNACVHSQASRIEVVVSYAKELVVRVSDNGRGIDPEIAEKGKADHFGLRGMRERAAHIGARLTLTSSANTGTEITLVVPGNMVFREVR